MSKDIMGEIDPFLLPFWFGDIHDQIRKIILSKNKNSNVYLKGAHGSMFRDLVWHLPDELKAKVMTPDYTEYKLIGNKENILKNSKAWNAWEHPRE